MNEGRKEGKKVESIDGREWEKERKYSRWGKKDGEEKDLVKERREKKCIRMIKKKKK